LAGFFFLRLHCSRRKWERSGAGKKSKKLEGPATKSGVWSLSPEYSQVFNPRYCKAIHTPRPVIRSGVMKGQPTYANERSTGDFSGLAEGGKRKGRKPPFS